MTTRKLNCLIGGRSKPATTTDEEGELMEPDEVVSAAHHTGNRINMKAPLPRVTLKRTSKSYLDSIAPTSSAGISSSSSSGRPAEGFRSTGKRHPPVILCGQCEEDIHGRHCFCRHHTLDYETSKIVTEMIRDYVRNKMPRKSQVRDHEYHCIRLDGEVVGEYCNKCMRFHKKGRLMHSTAEHESIIRINPNGVMEMRRVKLTTATTKEETSVKCGENEVPGEANKRCAQVATGRKPLHATTEAYRRRHQLKDPDRIPRPTAADNDKTVEPEDICRVVTWEPPSRNDQDSGITPNRVCVKTEEIEQSRAPAEVDQGEVTSSEIGKDENVIAPGSSVNRKLLFSSKFSDIKFYCPDGNCFPAHKNILAAASPTLASLLELDPGCSTMHLAYPSKVVEAALRATYEVPIVGTSIFQDSDLLESCLFFASSYQLRSFQKQVHDSMLNQLSVSNLKRTIQQAKKTEDSHLWKGCMQFVSQNHTKVLAHPSISSLAVEDPSLWKHLVEAPFSTSDRLTARTTVLSNPSQIHEDGNNKRRRVSIQ